MISQKRKGMLFQLAHTVVKENTRQKFDPPTRTHKQNKDTTAFKMYPHAGLPGYQTTQIGGYEE